MSGSDVAENPHAPAAAPTQSMEGAVLVDAPPPATPAASVPPEVSAAPLELAENPHAPRLAPTQSMEGAVLVEAGAGVVEAAASSAGVLVDNPQVPAAAPTQSMAGAVLVDAPAPASVPAPAEPTIPVPPPAVRVLPRRPRLRASFGYDAQDQITVELTLMDEKRDLIHRHTLTTKAGSTIARIFEALVGVAAQAASHAGVFGARTPEGP